MSTMKREAVILSVSSLSLAVSINYLSCFCLLAFEAIFLTRILRTSFFPWLYGWSFQSISYSSHSFKVAQLCLGITAINKDYALKESISSRVGESLLGSHIPSFLSHCLRRYDPMRAIWDVVDTGIIYLEGYELSIKGYDDYCDSS